jgi:hypothetical protein
MLATPNGDLPEVTSESEADFVDLVFHVHEHRSLADGSQVIRTAGFHKGRLLGFEVVLGPVWKKGTLGENVLIVMHRGEVCYRSIGVESDAFLQVLDDLFGTMLAPKGMAAETRFAAITLAGEPSEPEKGSVKIKLFYEKDAENAYAELYTNIDLAARRLKVLEKDPDYRAQIIRALRQD